MFGTAIVAKPVVAEEEQPTEADAEGEPVPAEPVIREYFDPAGRDKVIPVIKHLPPADRVLLAVENLDDAQVDLDKLSLLIKQWEPLEVQGLITEYEQDKEKETTVWHETEKHQSGQRPAGRKDATAPAFEPPPTLSAYTRDLARLISITSDAAVNSFCCESRAPPRPHARVTDGRTHV